MALALWNFIKGNKMAKNVIVIGGGASGLISAYYSALNGNNTIIIEKNEKLGKKIYITGKGRCNVTNDCDKEEFLANVVTNPKFLMSSIYAFSPQKLMELLENNGLRLKVERGNRVFPVSDKASDVIKCLADMCSKVGVKINLNEKVVNILTENGCVCGVKTDISEYEADKIIVATGGITYSQTGSTGDGYSFAKRFGHTIIEPIAGLSAIEIKDDFCCDLMGLSLKNVGLTTKINDKTVFYEFGEMLFTHFGVSGPIVLTTSSKINKSIGQDIKLYIDFKPALKEKQLDARLIRDFGELKNKLLKNSLHLLLPKRIIPYIISQAKLDGEKNTSVLTKEERQKLVYTIKNFQLVVNKLAPIESAIITCGGVSVKEINPKTMESKLIKGLHFVGEVLDVDAFTGGFNLQIAFATGYMAGNS